MKNGGQALAHKLREDAEFRRKFCQKVSEGTRKAILEKYRNDAEYRKRHLEGTLRSRTPKVARKISIALKKHFQNPENRLKYAKVARERQKKLWKKEKYRSKMLPRLRKASEDYYKKPFEERAGHLKALHDGYSEWIRTPEGKKWRSETSQEISIKRIINGELRKAYTTIENELAQTLASRNLNAFMKQHPIRDKLGRFVCLIDIAFPFEKIAVFCDGDFWHANPDVFDWQKLKRAQVRNLRNDGKNERFLKKLGWKVLRFYESEINEDPNKCSDLIERELMLRQ